MLTDNKSSVPSLFAPALAALLLIGCHTPANTTVANTIQVTGHGTDKPDPICENFRLTPEQVKTFFDKARPVTPRQLHELDYLPCWVEGVTTTTAGTSQWRIHPVGIARVTHPDGRIETLACKQCDDLFR